MKTIVFVIVILIHSGCIYAQSINDILVDDFCQGVVNRNAELSKCLDDNTWGNCVSIALIKTALATFKSLNGIYQKIEIQPNGGYFIVFQDNIQIELTKTKIDITKDLSKIKNNGNNKYYDSGIIVYASICERVFRNKADYPHAGCIKTFNEAVEYINSGYSTKNAYRLLGLNYQSIKPTDLKQEDAAVIWCSAHAAYYTKGKQDLMGNTKPIKFKRNKALMRNVKRYSKVKGAYKLCIAAP